MLTSDILQLLPHNRPTTHELLGSPYFEGVHETEIEQEFKGEINMMDIERGGIKRADLRQLILDETMSLRDEIEAGRRRRSERSPSIHSICFSDEEEDDEETVMEEEEDTFDKSTMNRMKHNNPHHRGHMKEEGETKQPESVL